MAANQQFFAVCFPFKMTRIKSLQPNLKFSYHRFGNIKYHTRWLGNFKLLRRLFFFRVTLIFVLFYGFQCFAQESSEEHFPEQSEIDVIFSGEQPEGVLFLVMEQDDEALYWVLPRVTHYTQQLREKWSDLAIVVLSHGDEMLSLTNDLKSLHNELHQAIKKLMADYNVLFQVCGSYASFADIDVSEFPDHIDVVPFAPAEIETYRQMGFKMINLELTW